MVKWRLDCEDCRHLTVVGLHDTGPRTETCIWHSGIGGRRLLEEQTCYPLFYTSSAWSGLQYTRLIWHMEPPRFVCLLVGCLTSQQHASVSQGRICTDNLTCCHTEIEAADPTFHLTQSQYTDTGPTSPSADPITPGAWQGSHWSANF